MSISISLDFYRRWRVIVIDNCVFVIISLLIVQSFNCPCQLAPQYICTPYTNMEIWITEWVKNHIHYQVCKTINKFPDFKDFIPDSNVHGANMGPTWVLSSPGGPHVGPMNLVIWDASKHGVHDCIVAEWDTRINTKTAWRMMTSVTLKRFPRIFDIVVVVWLHIILCNVKIVVTFVIRTTARLCLLWLGCRWGRCLQKLDFVYNKLGN